MRWEQPQILLALWALPGVALLSWYAYRKRVQASQAFVDEDMGRQLVPQVSAARATVKALLLMAGLSFLVVAAARPRWGEYLQKVSARGVDLFVLLDVSRSMLADDVRPNRLERAKSDIKDLLQNLKTDRVGLIVFAGAPVVKVPLTNDHGFYRMVLNQVDTDSAPRGGTWIGDAIRKALASMPEAGDRDQVIVLITDGEDHDSFPREAAKKAAERKVKIFSIGLGDSELGTRIPVRDTDGRLAFLSHEGEEIRSKMDEELLKEMALTTDGAYIPAKTRVYDLGKFYKDYLADLTRSEFESEKRKRYREQFQWFLALGVLCLMIESWVSSSKALHLAPNQAASR